MIINPKAIKALPEETYNKFYKFMLQEELYEDIHKLESIKDRLISKTLNDCVEDVMNKSDWIEL